MDSSLKIDEPLFFILDDAQSKYDDKIFVQSLSKIIRGVLIILNLLYQRECFSY
jgi:hypothetical protein